MEQANPSPTIKEPCCFCAKKPYLMILCAFILVFLSSLATYLIVKSSSTNPALLDPASPAVQISPTPSATADPTAGWKTYTNTKYKFSIKYPNNWEYLEVPTPTYLTETDQVWLGSSVFPPPQTGARTDIAIIFTKNDPSSAWQEKYFNNYKYSSYQLENVAGTKISGTSKEGLSQELIVIAKIGESYVQILSNQSPESLKYFDQILSTFKFID